MLSLCVIVKDEESRLENFLKRLKGFVDEIVLVDTGSKDKTKEIAKKFTKKIYTFKWNDDFSSARNFSISKARHDWILILDPDEVINKNDLTKIKRLILLNNKDTMGYRLIQKSYYNGKVISVRGICRLFKNDRKIKFSYPIHETVRESILSQEYCVV